MKNFDRIINSFEVHIKSKFEKQVLFLAYFLLLYDHNKIVFIELGNNHNTVNCHDRSMNFVHFRIFTLLSKDFQKEYTNHENAISELETGIWNWKLEIEQKHKLEVVHYIKADTTMKFLKTTFIHIFSYL